MSVTTLYESFKGTVESAGTADILGSEIGGAVDGHLASLQKVKAALGESWTVAEASIPAQEVEQEERQRQLPVVIPGKTSSSSKRRHTGEVSRVITVTEPARIAFTTQTYFVDQVRWFHLDGRIGEQIQFFGHFWDDHGTVKFYLAFGFPDETIEGAFFATAYWPERQSHLFSRPRVLVFSHETTAYGRDWEAGCFFLTELEFGPNLKAAAGDPEDPLHFGGTIGIENDQFTFDLVSWPERTLTFGGGQVVLESVHLYAKTFPWEDGEPPRTIPGDDPDEAPEDEAPDPHDAQFFLAGNLKLTDEDKPLVWSHFPADHQMACFALLQAVEALASAKGLDGLLGEQSWLQAFGGDLEGYALKELDVTVDLVSRELSFASYTLEGKVTLSNAAPDELVLDPARVSCQIPFQGGDGRQEIGEVFGECTIYGTTWEVHLRLETWILNLVSLDGQGFETWSQSHWYALGARNEKYIDENIDGTFTRMHVQVDLKDSKVWIGFSDDEGREGWV